MRVGMLYFRFRFQNRFVFLLVNFQGLKFSHMDADGFIQGG